MARAADGLPAGIRLSNHVSLGDPAPFAAQHWEIPDLPDSIGALMAARGSGGGAVSEAAAGGCRLMKGRVAAKAAGVRMRRLVCGRCRL